MCPAADCEAERRQPQKRRGSLCAGERAAGARQAFRRARGPRAAGPSGTIKTACRSCSFSLFPSAIIPTSVAKLPTPASSSGSQIARRVVCSLVQFVWALVVSRPVALFGPASQLGFLGCGDSPLRGWNAGPRQGNAKLDLAVETHAVAIIKDACHLGPASSQDQGSARHPLTLLRLALPRRPRRYHYIRLSRPHVRPALSPFFLGSLLSGLASGAIRPLSSLAASGSHPRFIVRRDAGRGRGVSEPPSPCLSSCTCTSGALNETWGWPPESVEHLGEGRNTVRGDLSLVGHRAQRGISIVEPPGRAHKLAAHPPRRPPRMPTPGSSQQFAGPAPMTTSPWVARIARACGLLGFIIIAMCANMHRMLLHAEGSFWSSLGVRMLGHLYRSVRRMLGLDSMDFECRAHRREPDHRAIVTWVSPRHRRRRAEDEVMLPPRSAHLFRPRLKALVLRS